MKKITFKKLMIAMGLILVLMVSIIACSSKSNGYVSYDGAYAAPEATYDDYEASYAVTTNGTKTSYISTSGQSEIPLSNRKMIRDADLKVETKEFDKTLPALESQIKEFGGYVQSTKEGGRSYRSETTRSAYLTARIPAENLDAFLDVVNGLGNITSKNLSTRDVTETYVDIESRLGVLRDEETALRNILLNADDTSDVLMVQERLFDVIEEIEANEARLRSYDSLIAYSTVDIDLVEVIELTPAPEETRGEELSRRFKQSLIDLKDSLLDFGVGFIVALPWLIVIGIIVTAIVLAVVLPIKAKNKKRLKKLQAEQAAKQQSIESK